MIPFVDEEWQEKEVVCGGKAWAEGPRREGWAVIFGPARAPRPLAVRRTVPSQVSASSASVYSSGKWRGLTISALLSSSPDNQK